jgi:hypothetical protein
MTVGQSDVVTQGMRNVMTHRRNVSWAIRTEGAHAGPRRLGLTKEGIAVTLRKTGRKMVFEWTDDLRAAVKRAQQLPTNVASIHLICQEYVGDIPTPLR